MQWSMNGQWSMNAPLAPREHRCRKKGAWGRGIMQATVALGGAFAFPGALYIVMPVWVWETSMADIFDPQ